MNKVIIYFFNFNILETCCSLCYYKNSHREHKLIEIDDIEALKKENITIDSVQNNFNNIYDKIVNLKNKIEKEIENINNLYEKTMENITKSYLIKHEQLLKEENDLKEKLQFQVTKAKEELENNLSKSNNNIKLSERIKKGIEKMKNKDENILKIISYISKANKTQKEKNNLASDFMKNIRIKYVENKNEINFEEYIFNGIPIPENIKIKDITNSSCFISWDIPKLNILNFDFNKIKYKIEIKKENEKFENIYEGNNNNYKIDRLTKNTNYNIRICSIYNDISGKWSVVQNIKTKESIRVESNILKESGRQNEFVEKLLEWTGAKNMELLYRGTRDGMNNKTFYEKCSNKGQSITIIKNDKGNIFGGYASISWVLEKDDKDYSAPESFLYTLTNIFNIEPTKFPSKKDKKEIRCYPSYGPLFGYGTDLGLYEDFINQGGWSNFGESFSDIIGKGRSIFTGDSNNNNVKIKIKEIEVFKIY